MFALSPLLEGTLIERFRLAGMRARDPICILYDAYDIVLGRSVTVEEFAPETLSQRTATGIVAATPARADEFAALKSAFLREAAVQGRDQSPDFFATLEVATGAFAVWSEQGPPLTAGYRLAGQSKIADAVLGRTNDHLTPAVLQRLGGLRQAAGRSRFDIARSTEPGLAAPTNSRFPSLDKLPLPQAPEPHLRDRGPIVGQRAPAAMARPSWRIALLALAGVSAIAIAYAGWRAGMEKAQAPHSPPQTQRVPVRRPRPQTDWVDFSLFAPDRIARDAQALLQIFLHAPDEAASVDERARMLDPEARPRGVGSLVEPIPRGTPLTIVLESRDFAIEPAVQTVIWHGRAAGCQFTLTHHGGAGTHAIVTAIILRGDAPVGRLSARLTLAEPGVPASPEPALQDADTLRYRTAFLSYSSQDRGEVLRRTQALRAVGIRCFQDVLDLVPGERWPDRLRQEVDAADLFLLFWSKAASASPHVREEIGWALARHVAGTLPEIRPIVLEGPPSPPPPEELSGMHFDDPLCYVMSAWAARTRPPA